MSDARCNTTAGHDWVYLAPGRQSCRRCGELKWDPGLTPMTPDRIDVYLEPSGAHAIVRELAEGFPPQDREDGCAFCNCLYHLIEDPANHAPECLWRRAKALYPGDQA